MDLEEFTMEELEQELKRRRATKPEILTDKEVCNKFTDIKKFLDSNMENVIKKGYPLKDFKYTCYEILIEAFYGTSIWDWFNKYNRGN